MNGIIDTIRYVLPYAADIRATVTTELQRSVFVTLTEQDFRVPGWLLSTGTLRLLAILAVLRHPNAPRLVFIEEVENGLDPRTLNLILDEIQRATESGRTQVVCTTHSPYFLDLLHLSQIILVERNADGEPTFTRPDPVALETWKNRFAPGKLYTMGVLNREYAGVGA